MSKERELLKKAIQIIETLGPDEEAYEFMNEILLLEPEQEPVAWMNEDFEFYLDEEIDIGYLIPLYTSPFTQETEQDWYRRGLEKGFIIIE